MGNGFRRKVSVRGNQDFLDIRLKDPMRVSAGPLGVQAALRHSFKEMGVVRSITALLDMNQPNGFSCPSCAWPDPERTSKFAEYCENGAKALADEATTSHIGADFFKKYSVEELSLLTDYELNAFGRIIEPLVLREGAIHYEPIDWHEAYELISSELKKLDQHIDIAP